MDKGSTDASSDANTKENDDDHAASDDRKSDAEVALLNRLFVMYRVAQKCKPLRRIIKSYYKPSVRIYFY